MAGRLDSFGQGSDGTLDLCSDPFDRVSRTDRVEFIDLETITVDASFATYETLSNPTTHCIATHQVGIGPWPVLIVNSQALQ
jgi:hypothetical protein